MSRYAPGVLDAPEVVAARERLQAAHGAPRGDDWQANLVKAYNEYAAVCLATDAEFRRRLEPSQPQPQPSG